MLMSDPPGSTNASTTANAGSSSTALSDVESSSSTRAEDSTSHPRLRSSVGVGRRTRPQTIAVGENESVADHYARRERPRSLIGSLRDRMFGPNASPSEEDAFDRLVRGLPGASAERAHRRTRSENVSRVDEDAAEDQSRDPIESLRERIASELMRALANRDGNSEEPSNSTTTPQAPSQAGQPTAQSLASGPLSNLPLSLSSPTSPAGNEAQHPEGSFDRFLHETNTELRRTLQERMNFRDAATARPIEIPAPVEESTPSPEAATPAGDDTSADRTTPAAIRLVQRAPEGVIEPRLNWWRMHRFPARIVAASSNPSSDSSTAPNESASESSSTSTSSPASTTLIPVIVVGIRTAPTTLVQEIGALAAQPSNTAENHQHVVDGGRRATVHRSGSSSSITIRAPPTADRGGRPPWARALESMARSLNSRRRDRDRSTPPSEPTSSEPPQAEPVPETVEPPPVTEETPPSRDRTRNYLIWVIGKPFLMRNDFEGFLTTLPYPGGYYPESHPILTSPNLLLNQFDQDDFWGLAELLGQVKPPVASKNDIERSGLELIKASQIAEHEKQGKITSNTSERVSSSCLMLSLRPLISLFFQCLICLSDYEPEEDIRVMSCKHAFHQTCVDKWLEVGRNNCPACRTKVRSDPRRAMSDYSADSFCLGCRGRGHTVSVGCDIKSRSISRTIHILKLSFASSITNVAPQVPPSFSFLCCFFMCFCAPLLSLKFLGFLGYQSSFV